jgi:hypothetical protein
MAADGATTRILTASPENHADEDRAAGVPA